MPSYSISPASGSGLVGQASAPFTVTVVPDPEPGEEITVNAIVDFEDGVAGSALTAANLTAATRGTTPGTWSLTYSAPLEHVKISATNLTPPDALVLDGEAVTGSGTRGIVFDMQAVADTEIAITSIESGSPAIIHTAAPHGRATGDRFTVKRVADANPAEINSTHVITVVDADTFTAPVAFISGTGGVVQKPYEGITWAGPNYGGASDAFSLRALVRFNGTSHEGQGATLDHIVIYGGGSYGVMQQHITDSTNYLNAHGQVGGTSTFGLRVPIEPDTLYLVTLRMDHVNGIVEIVVQDGVTLEMVGVSRVFSSIASPTTSHQVVIQDYLVFGAGQTLWDNIAFAWAGNARLPLAQITVPAPVIIKAVQIAVGTARLRWTGHGISYKVERWTSSGGWITLEPNHYNYSATQEYQDATVANGVQYKYRVTANVGVNTSTASESGSLTINDSPEGDLALYQENTPTTNLGGVLLVTEAPGEHCAQEIKGVHTQTLRIAKITLSIDVLDGRSGDLQVSVYGNRDGTGTFYGSTGTVPMTEGHTGEVEFSFFTPLEIPAGTDFAIRLEGDWVRCSPVTTLDEYRPGEGYDIWVHGENQISGSISDLWFKIHRLHVVVPLVAATPEQTGADEVTLIWADINDGATSYRVDQWTGGMWTDNVLTTAQGAASAVLPELTDGATYKWRVQAFIDGVEGSESVKVESATLTIDADLFPGPITRSNLKTVIAGQYIYDAVEDLPLPRPSSITITGGSGWSPGTYAVLSDGTTDTGADGTRVYYELAIAPASHPATGGSCTIP